MTTSTSPTSRALRTIEILQVHPGLTAAELGRRLGVTERAARRYVEILREAQVPVESERGPHGGYRLGRGLRLPPLVFTATEALGLVMAALEGEHPAGDPHDPVGSALGKVIRALPEAVGRPAAILREHAATTGSASARPHPTMTTRVVEAVAAGRRSLIGYRSEAGREWSEQVDPWSVVVRHGLWYLLCHSHRVDAVRTYRVDRVTSVEILDAAVTVPPGLDPVTLLEEHLGQGWEHETRVVFDAPRHLVARYVRPPMGRLEELAEERCVLIGSTSNPVMYAGEWLAPIPLPYRVEGGPELRAEVARLAHRLAAALEPSDAVTPAP